MRRQAAFLPAMALLCVVMPVRAAQEEGRPAAARAFVQLLAESRFAEATEGFDATMKSVMPPATLEAAWKVNLIRGVINRQIAPGQTSYMMIIVLVVAKLHR